MRFLLIFILVTVANDSFADRWKPISKRTYNRVSVEGVLVCFDSAISNKTTRIQAINLIGRLMRISRSVLPPHLFHNLSGKDFKIFVFQKRSVPTTFTNSAEYIRKNQFIWDKRVGKEMSISILLVDIDDFIAHDYYAISTFVHELAHFYHLECIIDSDQSIKRAYEEAKKKNLHKNNLYMMRSRHEYFAEVSTSFFGDKKWNRKYPRTATELRVYDPVGYKLCLNLWGSKQKYPKPALTKAPKKPVKVVYSSLNSFGRLTNYVPQKATITEAQAYDYYPKNILRSPFKSETDNSQEALKDYFNATQLVEQLESHRFLGENEKFNRKRVEVLSVLTEFKKKHPMWRNGLIINEINKIK